MTTINKEILLSIAIPTFNRAKYLDRCLSYLYPQAISEPSVIEIIVSDNCSTDNTYDIVQKYISKGLTIKYFKNDVNKGMDFNFRECYLKSNGKYVVVFSDDDIFFPGAISKILPIISNSEYGVIYLNSQKLSQVSISKNIDTINDINISIFKNSISILNRINHYVSYLSGNIVNRRFVSKEIFDRYMGTYLVHVPLILNAISQSNENLIIETPVIGMQDGNSGGYNLLKVFGDNFISILDNYDPKIKEIILKYIIYTSLPGSIYSLRLKNHTFIMEEDPESLLKKHFKGSGTYYLFFYPMLKLPLLFAKIYLVLIRYFFKCRKVFLNLIYSNGITHKTI